MRTVMRLLLAGCMGCGAGGAEETTAEAVEVYACVHIADGDIVDVALERDEARTIAIGRAPYFVNLYPAEAGFLRFTTAGPTSLVALVDFVGALPAVWSGEDRTALEPGQANPNCEGDLPEVVYFDVAGGDHFLEVGPAFQAAIWLMLAEL